VVGKANRQRQLDRPGRRWKDNVAVDFKDIGRKCVGWMWLSEADSCEHSNEPPSSMKVGECLD
jgi:hypothetical protein